MRVSSSPQGALNPTSEQTRNRRSAECRNFYRVLTASPPMGVDRGGLTGSGINQRNWLRLSPALTVSNDYLASRGIWPEVLEEFGVGFYSNPKSKSIVNDRILFPIHNQQGELPAFAARTTENDGTHYWFPSIEKFDRTLELWNLHRAIKVGREIVAVEGFLGCMNLWQYRYNCVALMGSNLSAAQCELLASEFETACFILDPDDAGRKLKGQVSETLLSRLLVRVIEPAKQIDLMTPEEIGQFLGKPR